ncbi:hypothetical protein C9374_007833 [Naegleria lovaniensis]|uniref:Uncharacterized protein n=1 Tax=Naegleria lovaniensis TaxID=51637 RepID=A0AA88KGK1_NAELO|nr:uncharacterized protein C9374_007833 [Naegleria lovaniensis]KAG2378685.1 hypothetical protein C9374_007833 [Naegleria lovaniensis]
MTKQVPSFFLPPTAQQKGSTTPGEEGMAPPTHSTSPAQNTSSIGMVHFDHGSNSVATNTLKTDNTKHMKENSAFLESEEIFTSHRHKKYHGSHHTNSSGLPQQHPLAPKTNYRHIIVSKCPEEKGITIIRINRPHVKNAVHRPCADELFQAFYNFEKDEASLVAILYGGEDMFCSGADLKEVAKGNMNQVESAYETLKGPMGPTRMVLSKPVIAAIGSGYCCAGGLELAAWCDLRVCKKNSIFGVLCRRFGVPLIDGGTIRLPALLGLSRAMDLILTGREIDGHEAFQIGLANRLVSENDNVLDEAIKLAKQLCSFPQLCMRHDKLSAYDSVYSPLRQKLQKEYEYGVAPLNMETLQGARKFSERHSKL